MVGCIVTSSRTAAFAASRGVVAAAGSSACDSADYGCGFFSSAPAEGRAAAPRPPPPGSRLRLGTPPPAISAVWRENYRGVHVQDVQLVHAHGVDRVQIPRACGCVHRYAITPPPAPAPVPGRPSVRPSVSSPHHCGQSSLALCALSGLWPSAPAPRPPAIAIAHRGPSSKSNA
jgi:hypothetical protein